MIQVVKGNDGGIRLYKNQGDRRKGVSHLKRHGYNYFVGYKDVNMIYSAGLTFGRVDWVGLFPYEQDI